MENNGFIGQSMKKGILIAIGILCSMITVACLCYFRNKYIREQLYWDMVAEETFVEALNIEVRKRAEISVQRIYVNPLQMQKLEMPIPDSVILISQYGRKKYQIPREKYEYSIVKEEQKRKMLSMLFEDHPLSVDSLNMLWDSLLVEKQIPITSRIRYSLTDLLEHTTVVYSKPGDKFVLTDSLSSRYMGFRCEMEVTGFVAYAGWTAFDGAQWIVLLLPWLLFGLLAVTYDDLCACLARYCIRQEVVVKEKEVVAERIVRALDDDTTPVKLYKLKEGVYLNTEKNLIVEGETVLGKMAPQAVVLLKMFFKAKNQRVAEADIYKELWNGDRNADRLHKALQRLRKTLEGITDLEIHYEENGIYQLRIRS